MINRKTVLISPDVLISYPRPWWEIFRPGWMKHVDGFGTPCWVQLGVRTDKQIFDAKGEQG